MPFILEFDILFSDLGRRNTGRGQLEVSRRQPIQVKVGKGHAAFLSQKLFIYFLLLNDVKNPNSLERPFNPLNRSLNKGLSRFFLLEIFR